MLVKFTIGVNFINILCAPFLVQKCFAKLFSTYILALNFFWQNNISQKTVCKMLMKFTVGRVLRRIDGEDLEDEDDDGDVEASCCSQRCVTFCCDEKCVTFCCEDGVSDNDDHPR